MDIINEKFNDIEEHLLKMNDVKKMINSLARIQIKTSEIKMKIKEIELKKLLKAQFNNYENIIDILQYGGHSRSGEWDGRPYDDYNFTLCNVVFTYSIPNIDKACEHNMFNELCINHRYTVKAKTYYDKTKNVLDDDIIKKFMAVALEYNISIDLYLSIVESICYHLHFDEEYFSPLNNYEKEYKSRAYSESNPIWSQMRDSLRLYTKNNVVSNMNIFYQSENDDFDSESD